MKFSPSPKTFHKNLCGAIYLKYVEQVIKLKPEFYTKWKNFEGKDN